MFNLDPAWYTYDQVTYYKNMAVHPCNANDLLNIYPPNANLNATFNTIMGNLYCFNNVSELFVYGDYSTNYSQAIQIVVSPCSLGASKCKPLSALSSKPGAWPYLFTVVNQQAY